MKHLEKNLLYLSHVDKVLTERIKSIPAASENGTIKILESPVGAPTLKTISYDGIESHDSIRRVDGSAKRLL